MNIDALLERVADEEGFPVSRDDLLDRYGDEPIEIDSDETSQPTPPTLREHLEGTPPEQSADVDRPEGGPPDRFESRKEMRTHIMSFRG